MNQQHTAIVTPPPPPPTPPPLLPSPLNQYRCTYVSFFLCWFYSYFLFIRVGTGIRPDFQWISSRCDTLDPIHLLPASTNVYYD